MSKNIMKKNIFYCVKRLLRPLTGRMLFFDINIYVYFFLSCFHIQWEQPLKAPFKQPLLGLIII